MTEERLIPPEGVARSWFGENGGCGKSQQYGNEDGPECGGICVLLAGHAGQCECIGDTPGKPGTCPA